MTLQEYIESLQRLIENNPEYVNMPLIYSKDDEGNDYHHVNYSPSPAQVEDLEEYYLELVWDEEGENPGTDFNCIMIN
jgi:hypothetical protein